ncbi:nucleoside phosphorylase domain-containing protein [Xylaria intraflava]|nr:nucleoside phosphorylase domain-containing protein [Xylaria intraflava]
MPLAKLDVLISEVERQIAIASSSSQQTTSGSNQNIEELVIDAQDRKCYLDLKDWCRILSQNDKANWEDIDVPLNFQKCLWKLITFSNASSPVINPGYQQSRCGDIQDIRKRDGFNDGCTEDIWQAAKLRSWATSAGSSLVIIQGTSQTTSHLEQFSYEISHQLGEIYPTFWMLSEPSSRAFFTKRGETELLRQLAIQALRKVSHFKATFLVDCLHLFKGCSTSSDWFQILRTIFQFIPRVYVIIDLSVMGNQINQAKNWPRDFQALISELSSSCSSKLAVMLLSSRPLSRGDPNTLVVPVTSKSQQSSQLQSRKRSLEASLNNSKRRLAEIMPMNEMSDDQAECSSSSALGAERVDQDAIPETLPSKDEHNNIDNPGTLEASFSNRQRNNRAPRNTLDSISKVTSPSVPPHRNSISIAIFCALTLEADAVLSVFDHHWDIRLFSNPDQDKNTYSIGKIGCHNVVLIHMSGMGRTPAATAAASCRTTFPGVSRALVVGICGAVPFHRRSTEIILGDVVISDRLVIYDFGRQFPDTFMRKEESNDSARKPPEEIRGFLSKMKTRRSQSILHSRTAFHLEALIQDGYPPYPGAVEDRLFKPSYQHKHQSPHECVQCASSESRDGLVCDTARISTCDALGCDIQNLVVRQRHSDNADDVSNWLPVMHFGAYASGDKVMKSGEHRDQIAAREEVIAFEMEGAGVWEIFPCIIVKGVCDYADSHKNKKWQDYAAAAAAACLKALLEAWPANISSSNNLSP